MFKLRNLFEVKDRHIAPEKTSSEFVNVLRKALASDLFSPEEKEFFRYKLMISSPFHIFFYRAAAVADVDQLSRLEQAFPCEIQAWKKWGSGNLVSNLKDVL